MKTIRSLLIILAGICLLMSCSESEDLFEEDDLNLELKKARGESKTVIIPFKVNYIGNYTALYVDEEECGDYPQMRVIVDGQGTGTHVGNSVIHFDFCCDVETGFYGYGETYAYIVAANGDSLFVTCSGQVIEGRLDDHPSYVISYWRDPFEILGGTGRFKGATGGGMTNDYNSSEDPNSHHQWTGTITLVRGRHHMGFSHEKNKPWRGGNEGR